jgi:hypothetical protein
MIDDVGRASPAHPELLVTSHDVEAGRVRLESEVALHRCPGCDVEWPDRYHFDCPECGHAGPALTQCRGCAGPLEQRLVRYSAEGRRGRVIKPSCGVFCPACDVSAVEEHALDALDAVAELAVGSLELLPEAGIFSSDQLEVLVDADVCGVGEPEQLEKLADGMRLRIGAPSALFEAALAVVTEQDPKDIFSPTLCVEPGPPYSAVQRGTFHRLLAEAQRELGAPVTCWSASVGLAEEPLIDPILIEQLMQLDDGGGALALYHAIASGLAPGRFTNTVRLLARVLGVPADGDVTSALRARLGALPVPPLEILQRLWLAMQPGRVFDAEGVYAEMAAFHVRYAALDPPGSAPRLPWEEPDYEGYAAWLRRLVSVLLGNAAAAG